jgi:putative phage-type endonuclease
MATTMLTPEQLEARKSGLGGSDAAAALGLSPWKSPLELYLEKRGEVEPVEGNERMRWGSLIEPVIREEYARRTGLEVVAPVAMVRHRTLPWAFAHPDGLIRGAPKGLEIKTASREDGWGEEGTDQVPEPYLLQTIHTMGVCELQSMDLAVLFGFNRLAIYQIQFDPQAWEMLAGAEQAFWERVQAGNPPEPDWQAPSTGELLRRLYTGTDGTILSATDSDEGWLATYREADELANQYLSAKASAKNHLLHTMGEASEMKFSDGTVLRRKKTLRKGYVVEASEYVDVRFLKPKKGTIQ